MLTYIVQKIKLNDVCLGVHLGEPLFMLHAGLELPPVNLEHTRGMKQAVAGASAATDLLAGFFSTRGSSSASAAAAAASAAGRLHSKRNSEKNAVFWQ